MVWLNKITDSHEFGGLVVIADPSNTYGHESKDTEELKEWFFDEWESRFNVFQKTDVITHPMYQWLAKQSRKPANEDFVKYVVERDGVTVTKYRSRDGPVQHRNIEQHLKRCLKG